MTFTVQTLCSIVQVTELLSWCSLLMPGSPVYRKMSRLKDIRQITHEHGKYQGLISNRLGLTGSLTSQLNGVCCISKGTSFELATSPGCVLMCAELR